MRQPDAARVSVQNVKVGHLRCELGAADCKSSRQRQLCLVRPGSPGKARIRLSDQPYEKLARENETRASISRNVMLMCNGVLLGSNMRMEGKERDKCRSQQSRAVAWPLSTLSHAKTMHDHTRPYGSGRQCFMNVAEPLLQWLQPNQRCFMGKALHW